MKGQYRVVKEVLLFAVGVAIASFVIVSFKSVQDHSDKIALEDQMSAVGNIVLGSVVKASSGTSRVNMQLPENVAGKTYVVKLESDTVSVFLLENPDTSVVKRAISLGGQYFMTGEVISTVRNVQVEFTGTNIIIRRMVQ